MKKLFLLLPIACSFIAANAQVSLTGQQYLQNFDNLASGLPTGWSTVTAANATQAGTVRSFNPIATTWTNYHGQFNNYASATLGEMYCVPGNAADSIAQANATDRALGVRQVGPTSTTFPNSDSGAAFIFEVANTTNLTNFNLSFDLQSVDSSSPRVTTWSVDYGFGASPAIFTVANATGNLTTGGHAFGSNPIQVNFGTVLNNQSQPVWIRVVALDYTTGSGNRPSTAIDNYKLTWSGQATAVNTVTTAENIPLTVIGTAISGNIQFNYSAAQAGAYSFNIYDLTGRIVYSRIVNAQQGSQKICVTDASLAAGMYVAKISDGKTLNTAKLIIQ